MVRPGRTFCAVDFAPDPGAAEADVVVVGAPHGTPYEPGKASHAASAPRAVREALGWYSANPAQWDFDAMTPVFGGAAVVDAGDVRHGFSSPMRRASEMAHVTAIVQLGARGPGSARASDYADARAWGARIFTARELHAGGLDAALACVPEGGEVFLAIDVDGIDPAVVPGVILPAFGGLDYTQMLELVHGVAAKAPIAGAELVEYVAERDPSGTGAKAISRIASNLVAAIGRQRGRCPPQG